MTTPNHNTEPFSKETVLKIHEETIKKFGGINGIRDSGLLDSALAQPFQTFDGVDLYLDIIAKACRYGFEIIADHPFIDGNKRTGTALLGTFLRINGFRFTPNPDDLLETVLEVAKGNMTYEELVKWVKSVANS